MYYTSKEVYEFISKQKADPILEWKTCAISGHPFPIFQSDMDVYSKASLAFAWHNFPIPTPTLCLEERQRRRLAFRNERKLYRRKCDFSGEIVISNYSQNKPHKVYASEIWRSDKRSPLDYGMEFDFTKPFFPQFDVLLQTVPLPSIATRANENSDYVNQCGYSKNCYLSFNTDFSENCSYCTSALRCLHCIDVINAEDCEKCYMSSDIKKSQKVLYSSNIVSSYNVRYSQSLVGCSSCFGCSNLSNKQYCLFNKQVSKEEFDIFLIDKMNRSQSQHIQNQTDALTFFATNVHQTMDSNACEQAYGNRLYNVKDAFFLFDGNNNENVSYGSVISGAKDCRDYDIGGYEAQLCVENASSGINYHCLYSLNLWANVQDCHYCYLTADCHDCFACVGLRNKEYCIFNKQYTKEEYELTVAKIISHMHTTWEWWEFFPTSMSPFGYNEAIVQQYYPLTKEETLMRWYKWEDIEYYVNIPDDASIVDASQFPDINDADESLVHKVIICAETQKPFRILKHERDFYQSYRLPLPRLHPNARFYAMWNARPINALYLRNCDKTGEEMVSVYPSNTPFKVYSEQAYRQEVYW